MYSPMYMNVETFNAELDYRRERLTRTRREPLRPSRRARRAAAKATTSR
jgi:hypothetical protein